MNGFVGEVGWGGGVCLMDFASQTEEAHTNVPVEKSSRRTRKRPWVEYRSSPAGGCSRLAPGSYREGEVFVS